MNEQELRTLVRAAVARHMGNRPQAAQDVGVGFAEGNVGRGSRASEAMPLPLFSSHTLYAGLVNVGDACVIEPAVSCDHCGYCKSHGY